MKVHTLSDISDNVRDASQQYQVVKDQLGAVSFDDVQKQWISNLAQSLRVVRVT